MKYPVIMYILIHIPLRIAYAERFCPIKNGLGYIICKHRRLPMHRIGLPAVGEYVNPASVGADVGDLVVGDILVAVVGVTVGDNVGDDDAVGAVVVGAVVGGNVNVPPGVCTHKAHKGHVIVAINSCTCIL